MEGGAGDSRRWLLAGVWNSGSSRSERAGGHELPEARMIDNNGEIRMDFFAPRIVKWQQC
ncbi:hypothetical protein ACP70R_032258 [Stipagrostis hirtigluma subsp. patula]